MKLPSTNEVNFPNRYIEKGRASKGAAYVLRGRAYLMQEAKYNYNNNTGVVESTTIDKSLLEKAISDFSKVKDCGYDLFQGGYKELFTEANEGCVEMIFSLQNISRPGYGSRMQKMAGTRSSGDQQNQTGFSQYSAPPAMVDLYEYKDGRPFDWNEIIPGYFDIPVKDRLVYFLRDKEINGIPFVSERMDQMINNKIPEATKNEYLGTDADLYKLGNTAPVPYVFRWPVGAINQSVNAQINLGISSPYDLRQDGTGEAEFAYRHRKFLMEGYDCEYIEDNPIDEPILRYAYVLLMWAEALTHMDNLTEAAEKTNLIRGRKSVEMPAYTFANKDDAMSKIRDESRRELINEGVNFYEELRWGTLRQTKFSPYMGYEPAAHTCNGMQSSGNGTVKWSTTNDYSIFPVPSTEIEKNSNLKKHQDGSIKICLNSMKKIRY